MMSLAFVGLNVFIVPTLGFIGLALAAQRYLKLKRYDLSENLKLQIILNLKNRKLNPIQINKDLEARLSSHPTLGPLFAELKYPHLKKARLEAKSKIKNLGHKLSINCKHILNVSILTFLFCVTVAIIDLEFFISLNSKLNGKNPDFVTLLVSNKILIPLLGFIISFALVAVSHWLNCWCRNIIKNMNDIFDATEAR
jgi:hypothetical protein